MLLNPLFMSVVGVLNSYAFSILLIGIKMKNLRILLLVAFSACVTSAQAGGLFLREFGQPSSGTGTAGNNVMAEDASIAFSNPAGVFLLKDKSEWVVTGIVLDSSVKFRPDDQNTVVGGDGGDAGDTLVGGALFYARQVNDKWGATFSLNSVAGSALEYDDEFVGRYTGYDTKLLTVTATPSIAYKFNDQLSVALTAPVVYGELELKQSIPPLLQPAIPDNDGVAKIDNGDDTDIALGASVLWQATEDWRFAANYFGGYTLDFEGDLNLTLPGAGSGVTLENLNANVEIELPQSLSLSAMKDLNEQVSLFMRIGWEDWSTLDTIPLSVDVGGAEIEQNWDDVYSVSVGMRWRIDDKWTYYSGFAYDSDPGNKQDRIAILPIDRQWRISGGLNYQLSQGRRIGGTFTWLDLGSARTRNNTSGGVYSGKYTTNRIVILGLNYAWQ